MLHGCTQNPDDFAAGTAMNEVAEKNGLLVAYPHQSVASNPASCWNWFNPADQVRDQGEPAILAGMTRALATEFNIERHAVFVAGLSAGGAMAAVLAETYPDLYSGVGIHSGLAYRSANDVITAFAAMRGQTTFARAGALNISDRGDYVRTIVFHGSADKTVHPANAEHIAAAAGENGASKIKKGIAKGNNGRSYTRIVVGRDDSPVLERWTVDGSVMPGQEESRLVRIQISSAPMRQQKWLDSFCSDRAC
jgi:poly(hydroxyalkanoate) depolymerase family esterase